MTIYIHFIGGTPIAKRLCNVAAVLDAGPRSVRAKMQFTDEKPLFKNVSHVALETDKENGHDKA